MRTFAALIVGVVLMTVLSYLVVMAAPPMPNDVQIVQPDPSLPKELLDFFGKWEWQEGQKQIYIIVEKIDEQKANLYIGRFNLRTAISGWNRYEAKVYKEREKYLIWYHGPFGSTELTLRGEYLNVLSRDGGLIRYERVQ